MKVEPLVTRLRASLGSEAGTLILLHGRGSDENDLFGLLALLDPGRRLRCLTVGAPLRLPDAPGKHWYTIPKVGHPDPATFFDSLDALTALLDVELGVDWGRTVIGGWSQGTVMAYAVGLRAYRPLPAGILAQSGFIPTVQGWDPGLHDIRDLPVLLTHGERDDVIPVDFARRDRQVLEAAGARLEYQETGMAHRLDPRTLPGVARWLRALL